MQENEIYLRASKWGMKMEEVKAIEKAQISGEDKSAILYTGKLSDYCCSIVYIFVNNKLCRSKYILNDEYSNDAKYLANYAAIADLLKAKYGAPSTEQEIVLDYDGIEDKAMAIKTGKLGLITKWNREDSCDGIILSGDNYIFNLTIEYICESLKDEEDDARRQAALDDL